MDAVRKKMEKFESKKKEKEWSNTGVKKQVEFAIDIREYHEELDMGGAGRRYIEVRCLAIYTKHLHQHL